MLEKLKEDKDGTGGKAKKKDCSLVGWCLFVFLVLLGAGWPAISQAVLTCTAQVAVPPAVRGEGLTERVGDLILACSGGTPGVPLTADFQIFLNTNITSNLLNNDTTPTTEALLLLNEPDPVLQVLGANVFRGLRSGGNSINWSGVAFAPDLAGNAVMRFTNIRANASGLPSGPLPGQVLASISSFTIPITNPLQIVGFVSPALNFSTSGVTPGTINLNFRENFATAFLKKIEVDASGVPIDQNVPGTIYLSETGFTTHFSGTDTTGRADTGTRLVARFKNLPAGTSLVVPTTIQSNNSTLMARLFDQVNPDYSGGQPAPSGLLPICQNSTHAVYEIEGPAGITGANVIDTFTIPVTVLGPLGFGGGVVNGNLGPISATSVMSLEAPEPRFVDQASGAFPLLSCITYLPLINR